MNGNTPKSFSLISLAAILSIFLSGWKPLPAHSGHHIMGVVMALEGNTLVMRTREGVIERVNLHEDTQYRRGNGEASRSDLTAGRRIVVHLSSDHTHAELIRIGE